MRCFVLTTLLAFLPLPLLAQNNTAFDWSRLRPSQAIFAYHDGQTIALTAGAMLGPAIMAKFLVEKSGDPSEARLGTRAYSIVGGSIGGIIGLSIARKMDVAVDFDENRPSGLFPDGGMRALLTMAPAMGAGWLLGARGHRTGLRSAAGDKDAHDSIRVMMVIGAITTLGHGLYQYAITDW